MWKARNQTLHVHVYVAGMLANHDAVYMSWCSYEYLHVACWLQIGQASSYAHN